MIYGVCTIEVPPGKVNDALAGLREAVTAGHAGGKLLACWYSEIGHLNRVLAIFAHDGGESLAVAQQNALKSDDPFGVAAMATHLTLDAYAAFPDFPVLTPGDVGPIFEVREYRLRKAGLAPTIELWRKQIPLRSSVSPLGTALYALNGLVPRFMHIWPYRTLNDRLDLRNEAVKQGVWPPPGGLAHIEAMHSEIFLPAAFSPVH